MFFSFPFFAFYFLWTPSRGHPKQVAGETLNLLSRKPKKKIWKVKAAPENDEDDDEATIKEVGWVWSTTLRGFFSLKTLRLFSFDLFSYPLSTQTPRKKVHESALWFRKDPRTHIGDCRQNIHYRGWGGPRAPALRKFPGPANR
jgi:hypothetical protein